MTRPHDIPLWLQLLLYAAFLCGVGIIAAIAFLVSIGAVRL